MAVHLRHAAAMTPDNYRLLAGALTAGCHDLLDAKAAARLPRQARRIAESLRLGIRFHWERAAE